MKEQQKQYWRSLDELDSTPEYRQFVEREFPVGASEMTNDVDRRKFLILAAAGIGMAGLTACRRPVEKIIPAGGKVAEQVIPGVPQQYATIYNLGGQAQGLLVQSNDGRPTKIEGNPAHPASLGATNGYAQASILDLYDPDRSKSVKQGKDNKSWDDFIKAITPLMAELKGKQGEGLRFLAETNSSPALRELRNHIATAMPSAKWHTYDAVSLDNALAGANLAFGQSVHTHYAFDKADVILALDSDFLGSDLGSTVNIKNFSKKRRTGTDVEAKDSGHGDAHGAATAAHGDEKKEEPKADAPQSQHSAEPAKAEAAKPGEPAKGNPTPVPVPVSNKMNRLYAVESNFTVTGAMADHRLRLQSSKISGFLAALAKEMGVTTGGLDKHAGAVSGNQLASKWVKAVAKDLSANKGRAVVVVGSRQPAHVHALACLINSSIAGDTVKYTRAFEEKFESGIASLKALVDDANAGKVNTLIVLGGNPVYNAPADLKFREALSKVQSKIHLGLYQDESAVECNWHVNEAHYLECWGDGRAYDGTASIQQPLIAPLHNGKSAIELLAVLSGYAQTSGYDIVKTLWLKSLGGEKAWNKAVHDGVIANTAFAPLTPAANAGAIGSALDAAPVPGNGLEINFVQDSSMYDGRFANNGWMQEVPDPMTKLVWDNAALMSNDTAEKLGVKNEDIVKLTLKGRELQLPVWILPGHAKDSITVALGYGRTESGRIGRGFDQTFGKVMDTISFGNTIGSNTYLLRTSDAMDFALDVNVAKTSETHKIAVTQDHWSMEGRPLVREATLDDFVKTPEFAKAPDAKTHIFTIFNHPYDFKEGNQWGMAIDLNTCVGCNACVLACQSENNIPIVGKDHVLRGREMHWIRMDRYFTNIPQTEFTLGGAKPVVFDEDQMQAVQQPMACQQCEHAPCEEVCPVAATVHNEEGLNTMAYNRCVGTRYCSNNCPFKVRRFNYLNWHKGITDTEKMQQNPDVTVRMRGVMEKCTYCTQRISAAKHQAKVEGHRAIRDGEITPACAQVCPADAITFGNINDPNSRVSKLRKQARNYQLLVELNINPRTTYLAKLRNTNKELEA
ncbi:MAG: TAT-variant-translocated molybdopterin oxidoreductase [Blastocatellia bacterium]|nr:TAT-variant-translocated molybdopterin oxidoreductase [Blastocatellia bacterium]